jgi:hypothetical protein
MMMMMVLMMIILFTGRFNSRITTHIDSFNEAREKLMKYLNNINVNQIPSSKTNLIIYHIEDVEFSSNSLDVTMNNVKLFGTGMMISIYLIYLSHLSYSSYLSIHLYINISSSSIILFIYVIAVNQDNYNRKGENITLAISSIPLTSISASS